MDPDLIIAGPISPDGAPQSAAGITIDVAGLRAAANRVDACATDVARVELSGIDPHALPGSAVSVIAGPALVTAHRAGLVAQLAGWAAAARTSADQFEHAEACNADRIAKS
jgi:hypothetical protein